MDIFGRCNGAGGSTVTGSEVGIARVTSSEPRSVVASGTSSGTADSTETVTGSETETTTATGIGTGSRMQLTGASAPGAAASPESGVSPLADAYMKMTSDILAERTLGDSAGLWGGEHSGELVKTGEFFFLNQHFW